MSTCTTVVQDDMNITSSNVTMRGLVSDTNFANTRRKFQSHYMGLPPPVEFLRHITPPHPQDDTGQSLPHGMRVLQTTMLDIFTFLAPHLSHSDEVSPRI